TASFPLNGFRYRAVFTNSFGTATTNVSTLMVNRALSFTSAKRAAFLVGQPGSFLVMAQGFPAATFAVTAGALPAGIGLTNNGEGTPPLGGTPIAGAGGAPHH